MLSDKTLANFTSLFSPYDFEKTDGIIWVISKVNKCNSIEIDKKNLTDQIKYRLNEITKIENYFIDEKTQRKSYTKKSSKYLTNFDYI